MNIFELLTASNFITYWQERDAEPNYVLQEKFPVRKTNKVDMKMIKGRAGVPVVLEPSAFDADPSLRQKVGVTAYVHDLPFFREADRYGEQELMDIDRALKLGEDDNVTYILRDLFDYQGELVRGALARLEQMRWQVVLNGGIEVQANLDQGRNVAYQFSFDPDNTWANNNVVTIDGTSAWNVVDDTATGNPIEDLDDIINTAQDAGTIVSEAYMNTTTFRTMMSHPAVKEQLNPNGMLQTREQQRSLLSDYLGLNFHIYDGRFNIKNEETGEFETQKFIPDGVISLQPAGQLGTTYLGATPEELGVITSQEVELQNMNGLSIMRFQEGVAPINHMFVVSFLGMPSFESMDSVYKLVAF